MPTDGYFEPWARFLRPQPKHPPKPPRNPFKPRSHR
jgi:hypothetical protein